jgi:hypothetical protein
LAAAIAHERTLGIDAREADDRPSGEDIALSREASLVHLSKDGAVTGRDFLSAGLGISVQGMEPAGQRVIAYGSLGGRPALTRH